MQKKYIIKNFITQKYYGGEMHGHEVWASLKEYYVIEFFSEIEDAENFIKREQGMFQIEAIYIAD